ncbi:MAG: rieske 2fe2s domain containing [Prolixibacteraceae bacterium]|nr:MAG: rieske 2fe2s domain containing [Prolixibacteraceae bacterium]
METRQQLLAKHREGWSLDQGFYLNPEIFDFEKEVIWKKSWLFAGFTCEIPNPGDYITYSVIDQPVVIIRGDEGEIYAHHNTCRHRGSVICTEESGNEPNLVCPYHNWVFAKNGALKNARQMEDGFDKESNGLHPVNLKIIEGFMFISLSDTPPRFETEMANLEPYLKPFRFNEAKVAFRDRYELDANWKLVVENFRECYHCGPAHPEYCDAVVGANMLEEREEYWQQKHNEWKEKGLAVGIVDSTVENGNYIIRYPFRPGVDTYSIDGRKVAPLMGDHKDYDNGVVGLLNYPNIFMDCVSDYTWTMRITPIDTLHTVVDLIWLVDGKAEEGIDYEIDRLTEFWVITGGQDWQLCENNQKGIRSAKYASGKLAPSEADVQNFHNWYIHRMK